MSLLKYNNDLIYDEWKIDSQIGLDKTRSVQSESIRVNNLHYKYLGYLKDVNRSLYQFQERYALLFKNKSLYYDGALTREQIDAFKWAYDPFNGLIRPKTKDKLKIYFDADEDLLALKSDIKELESMYETLKHILKQFDNHTFFFNTIKPIE